MLTAPTIAFDQPLEAPGPEGPSIGGLFEGYGGLSEGVRMALGGELVWYADICGDPAKGTTHRTPHGGPCAILAHHYPDVLNLGDVTSIAWADLPRVHILTGGSPCQDLSHAGRRKGMTEGTRSNLWVAMREGIRLLRPNIVVWENVRGAFSTEADSELVVRPGLLDGVRRRRGEPVLRALGRVLGDLADLGYDARWYGVRASDVGACHPRFRVFVVATDASVDPWWELDGDGLAARAAGGGGDRGVVTDLLPTPTTQDGANTGGPSQLQRNTPPLNAAVTLLPTPAATQSGNTPENHRKKPGRGVVTDLGIIVENGLLETGGRLLPTPEAKLGTSGPDYARRDRAGTGADSLHEVVGRFDDVRMLPTPNGSDHKGSAGTGRRGRPPGDADLPEAVGRLLPTPTDADSRAGRNSTARRGPDGVVGSVPGHEGDTLTDWSTKHEAGKLLPTPSAALAGGGQTSRSGDRIDEQLLPGLAQSATEGKLLPTPRGTDGSKGGPNQAGSSGDLMLPSAVQPDRLLPTPRVAADRTSRGALTRDGHWSAPGLGQAVELASGILPREYDSWDEVQGVSATDRLLPSPQAHDAVTGKTPAQVDAMKARSGAGVSNLNEVTFSDGARDHRSAPSLPELRAAARAEALRLQARGSDPVPVEEDLRSVLRQQPGGGREVGTALARSEAPGEELRGVRDDLESARAPQGPGRDEQRPGEHRDAVRQPPPKAALGRGPGDEAASRHAWGDYAPAIARWERVLGRVAPEPTERTPAAWARWEAARARRFASPLPVGMRGSVRPWTTAPTPQLSPLFVEFMMGLPVGWVTDVPGVTRNEQLKALGNGVVPLQAAYAVLTMLTWRLP